MKSEEPGLEVLLQGRASVPSIESFCALARAGAGQLSYKYKKFKVAKKYLKFM